MRARQITAQDEEQRTIVAANRRPYVGAKTRRQMPKPITSRRSDRERAANRARASRFWSRIESATTGPGVREQILTEATASFELWLLTKPQYGPIRYAPEGYAGTTRIPVSADAARARDRLGRYKAGRISPVGMTLERAIEIAIAVMDEKSCECNAPSYSTSSW